MVNLDYDMTKSVCCWSSLNCRRRIPEKFIIFQMAHFFHFAVRGLALWGYCERWLKESHSSGP